MINIKKLLNNKYVLPAIICLGFVLRVFSISHNHIFFYFDQARDATISRQIIEQKDFKIMGPSVSGTQDSVYHGVLYYYLIAPFYYFGHGNPYIVTLFLITIGTLSILITYLLGKEVFNSKTTGLIAAFLHATSVICIHQSTWLSNPTLSGFFVPLTYYLIWRVFFSSKTQPVKFFLLLGISLALSVQSALQNITILGSILIAFIYSLKFHQQVQSFKKMVILLTAFAMGIMSMVLTEFLMYQRGILSFDTLNLEEHSASLIQVIQKIILRYYALLADLLNPMAQLPWLVLAVVLLIICLGKISKKQIIWSLSFILAPIWLLIWHFRDPNHTFIGIEVPTFLLIANGLTNLITKNQLKKTLAILFMVVFVFSNISQMLIWKEQQFQYFGIQKGAFLNSQLQLIDKTYSLANGEPFSFSSLTSPYAINTTWNYLYKWYGQQQYGFVPSYVGINQNNFVGNDILPEKSSPKSWHFLINEPDTTLSKKMEDDFFLEQKQFSNNQATSANYEFGRLKLMSLHQ